MLSQCCYGDRAEVGTVNVTSVFTSVRSILLHYGRLCKQNVQTDATLTVPPFDKSTCWCDVRLLCLYGSSGTVDNLPIKGGIVLPTVSLRELPIYKCMPPKYSNVVIFYIRT